MKLLLIRVASSIMTRLPLRGRRSKALLRRLHMAHLARTDICEWRVEKARDAGARVGRNCHLLSLNMFSEPYLIEIGDNVTVSGDVAFVTHDGAIYTLLDEIPNLNGHYGKIKIGNNCFIGMGAIILPNVQIGDNCIVGAGAVVFDSFPDNSVVIGNPAKVAFSHGVYRQMRKASPFTIADERYRFPAVYPRELMLQRIGHLPIKQPRRNRG